MPYTATAYFPLVHPRFSKGRDPLDKVFSAAAERIWVAFLVLESMSRQQERKPGGMKKKVSISDGQVRFGLILARRSLFVWPLILLPLMTSCGRNDWHRDPSELHTSTLKIEVFGSTASNEQHYSSILTGAEAAAKTDRFTNRKQSIRLEPLEDAKTTQQAIETARRIRDDPDVLAVVGHSYSSTTR